MGKGEHLGEFEQLVLLAVAQLEGDGYGVTIRREIRDRGGRDATVPAVYATLDRLASKGYVSTREDDATPERGGRAKRYYRLEPSGARALLESKGTLDRMWDGLDLEAAVGRT